MKTIRLLVADDHKLLRQSLSVLLDKESGIEVVGQAADGGQALDLVASLRPDIVLMDIAMPRLNGIEATRRIKAKYPDMKVLILSMHDDDRYISRLFRAGAAGYVLKDASKQELLMAIQAVNEGQSYLSPVIARKLIDGYVQASKGRPELYAYLHLTNREREIFQLMIEEKSNRQIGEILHISPKTAKNHRANIMNKLNLHSQREVIEYAKATGLPGPKP